MLKASNRSVRRFEACGWARVGRQGRPGLRAPPPRSASQIEMPPEAPREASFDPAFFLVGIGGLEGFRFLVLLSRSFTNSREGSLTQLETLASWPCVNPFVP